MLSDLQPSVQSYADVISRVTGIDVEIVDSNMVRVAGTGIYADLTLDERRAIAEDTFLPRPKRTLESDQYTLDAKVDMPFELAGKHIVVVGGQVIRGELTDGVFGMVPGPSTTTLPPAPRTEKSTGKGMPSSKSSRGVIGGGTMSSRGSER